MNLRRVSVWFSIGGGAAWLTAALFLLSRGWGETTTVSSDPSGVITTETPRTASVFQSSPDLAARWLLAVCALSLVAGLLLRFGGLVGLVVAGVVAGLGMLLTVLGMLTIGVLIAPGASLWGAAVVLAAAARVERRKLAALPPPPPVALA